jgi:cephalosporin hydroxylase
MNLYQFGKRILKSVGLLGLAAYLKGRWTPFCQHMQYRRLLAHPSKEAYLRYYDHTYKRLLQGGITVFGVDVDRYTSYRLIFEELLSRKEHNFTIIETGCAFGGGWCHGSSSFLFMEFLNVFGGKLISIDINQEHMDACGRLISTVHPFSGRAHFVPMVGDSLAILQTLPDQADFVYLDSWDLEQNDPEPSMRHHMAEFRAAKSIFVRSQDLIVAVDDNLKPLNIGKGKYILEWAQQTRQNILLDAYQLVLRITADKIAEL